MRELDVVDQAEAIPLADAEGRRGPLADAVEGQDRGVLEGRGEERAGGVALVVIGEDQPGAGRAPQAAADRRTGRETCGPSSSGLGSS